MNASPGKAGYFTVTIATRWLHQLFNLTLRKCLVGFWWVLILSVSPLWAQIATNEPPATLTLHDQEILTLRASVYGLTPAKRASDVKQRFQTSLKQDDPGEIAVMETPMGALITLDERAFLLITPEDTAEGETVGSVASNAVTSLRLAYTETRADQSTRSRVIGIVVGCLDTVLFVLVLIGIGRARRWCDVWLLRRAPSEYRTEVARVGNAGLAALIWVLRLVALYAWLRILLFGFAETRWMSRHVGGRLWSLVSPLAREMVNNLPDLLVVTIIFIVTRFLARVIKVFFLRVAERRIRLSWLDADTARPTQRLVVILLWLSAFVMAYPYLPGSGSQAFRSVGVFMGLLVSLGASGVVGQITSGMLLVYSKTFKPGEYVRINENEGTIVSVGLLSTRLRTPKNEEISIPNAVLIGATTKNYSRLHEAGGVLLHTTITIGYSTPWRQVHELLKRAAGKTRGLRPDPPPFVLQTALSDFYVEYQINARIDRPEDRLDVLAELHQHILDEFNEHGVQIMSPHYMADPPQPQVVPKANWHKPPAGSDMK